MCAVFSRTRAPRHQSCDVMPKLTRRQTLQVAASVMAAATLPASPKAPEFWTMLREFRVTMDAFREAQAMLRSARPRILQAVKAEGYAAFFRAAETRDRARARWAAVANAERIIMTMPVNSLESIVIFEVAHMYSSELGGSPGMFERSLEARRARSKPREEPGEPILGRANRSRVRSSA